MYQIIKRDGKIVDFDINKITSAIKKAFEATDTEYTDDIIDFIALKVSADFLPKIKDGYVAVEDIQDSVEAVLARGGYEGVAKALMQGIKNAFYKNTLSKLSYLGVRSGINDMKTQFDYKEYGGAVMLGVRKPVIKAHGSADARCFKNAIKQAVMFLQTDLIDKIEKELQSEE